MKRKAIPSHPLYSADEAGNIYGKAGKKLKLFPGVGGYLRFTTYESGRWQQVSVHVMVCETFHGTKPPGMVAAHEDGDVLNNVASNLSWKTRQGNEEDKRRHGRALLGTRHHQHKLTDQEVNEIRTSPDSGADLARKFNVSQTAISYVRRRKTWRHLP